MRPRRIDIEERRLQARDDFCEHATEWSEEQPMADASTPRPLSSTGDVLQTTTGHGAGNARPLFCTSRVDLADWSSRDLTGGTRR